MAVSAATKVSVIHCAEYHPSLVRSAAERLFESLGGAGRLIKPGQRVLIKPNLIVPRGPQVPAQTHPEVIYAVAEIVKDFGAFPLVGDSPAWSTTRECLKILGVDKRLEQLGAEIVQLNDPVKLNMDGSAVSISRVALEADAIINLPKLKAHQQLGATFAVKNMYGCVAGLAGKEKAYWHFARGRKKESFCQMLAEIYKRLNPILTIIDAVVGMEGQGPINGQPRDVGYLVAGINPVACERVCCDLVGFNTADLPILAAASKAGLGSLTEPIEVTGDPYTTPACENFKPAEQVPLQFTLRRICKSICKQGIMLVSDAFRS